MSGEHKFSEQTQREVCVRQHGNCACCGKGLLEQAHYQGHRSGVHHVVPNQSGEQSQSQDPWMSTSANGVYLCGDCHKYVHQHGNYRNGAVAGPETFKYSHGSPDDPASAAEHGKWCQTINNRWDQKHEAYKAHSR